MNKDLNLKNKWWGWINQSGLIILEKLVDMEEYEDFCNGYNGCLKCSEIFAAPSREQAKEKLRFLLNFKDRMWIREDS